MPGFLCIALLSKLMVDQDKYQARVFERSYARQFSCSTFPKKTFESCKNSSNDVFTTEEVERAVIKYARDNVALVKVDKLLIVVYFHLTKEIKFSTFFSSTLDYLKVFLRDPFFTQIARDQRITFIQFLGSAGGLVGLTTGFSVVSGVEIFYHLALTITRICKWNK